MYRVQYRGGVVGDTKITSFTLKFTLESPLGAQKDYGKGPSWVGQWGVTPLSTAPCPKIVKRRFLERKTIGATLSGIKSREA